VGEIEREIRKKERKRERETNQNNKAMICRDIAPLYQLVREGIFPPFYLNVSGPFFSRKGKKFPLKVTLPVKLSFSRIALNSMKPEVKAAPKG
jgi:hypothetical protein